MDNAGQMDIVVGRDSAIGAYNGDTGTQIFSISDGTIILANPDSDAHNFHGADVNGDGYVDIVVSGSTSSTSLPVGIYVYYNDGAGSFWKYLAKDLYTEVRGGANTPGNILSLEVGDTLGA